MHLTTAFLQELSPYRDSVQAEKARRYHKSTREHWGIRASDLDSVTKRYVRQHPVPTLLQLSQALWQTQIFDVMMAGGRILAQKKIPASEALWELVTTYLEDVDGWALEDQLYHAAWKCLLQTPSLLNDIETWTTHDNMWMRRAALVYTLPYSKPGHDPERVLTWMAAYASDSQWFIQKAIGWWLRQLGQHNPQRVIEFLAQHGDHLKHVARHEATRKLDKKWLKQRHERWPT